MVKKLTNNLGWKTLSLVLAFLLWLIVVNTEDPQVSTTIRGIVVEKQNVDAITSKKWAIQSIAGDTVDVKVKGKRSIVYKLTQNNIKAYADMTNLSITGAVDIQLDLPNEVELVSKSPSSVVVELENIITKKFEIQYEKEGKTKAGFVDLSPIITPSTIDVEAAESIVYKIEKIVAAVDISGISGDLILSVIPEAYDYAGNPVSDIKMSSRLVQVKVPVEKSKILPIHFEPKGEVAPEHSYIGHNLSETSLIVRGKSELVDGLQEVLIDTVSIQDKKAKEVITVNLAKLLPDGVSLNQDKSTVDVTLEIEPLITKDFEFIPSEIPLEGIPTGKKIEFLSNEPIIVKFKGIQSRINEIEKEALKPYIYIDELENGNHSVVVQWDSPQDLERISKEIQIQINVSDAESSTESGQ